MIEEKASIARVIWMRDACQATCYLPVSDHAYNGIYISIVRTPKQ